MEGGGWNGIFIYLHIYTHRRKRRRKTLAFPVQYPDSQTHGNRNGNGKNSHEKISGGRGGAGRCWVVDAGRIFFLCFLSPDYFSLFSTLHISRLLPAPPLLSLPQSFPPITQLAKHPPPLNSFFLFFTNSFSWVNKFPFCAAGARKFVGGGERG